MGGLNIFTLVLITGLVTSLNPVSISVYSALLSGMRGKSRARIKTELSAIFYLLFYFLLVFIVGAALLAVFSAINFKPLTIFSLISAILAIIIGLSFIRRYFWHLNRINAPRRVVKNFHIRTMKQNHILSSSVLGISSAIATLPSNGGILLCLASILVLAGTTSNIWYMFVFTFCLILPLFLIFVSTQSGIKITAILKWKESNKNVMYLTIGLVNILLAWILLLILNGIIGLA